jgi:hypothetical protein
VDLIAKLVKFDPVFLGKIIVDNFHDRFSWNNCTFFVDTLLRGFCNAAFLNEILVNICE